MRKLYIDDIRNPKFDGFEIVRTSAEAISYMEENGCPGFISFDHDLGGDDTAMIVVHWMIETDLDEKGLFIPSSLEFHVHSANPVGARNINGLLGQYLKLRSQYEVNKIYN